MDPHSNTDTPLLASTMVARLYIQQMAEWQKLISEKYQQPYWFNALTGESRWEEPLLQEKRPGESQQKDITDRNNHERRGDEEEQQPSKKQRRIPKQHSPVDIVIIVPFRDLHHEQKRLQQLQRFVPVMTR